MSDQIMNVQPANNGVPIVKGNSFNASEKLALAIFDNPGVYALLLGSGISRAAGIPTGWEIALALIKKVAILRKAGTVSDLEAWYRREFNEPPFYSGLLKELASTPAERASLLRSYFEPTEAELRESLKTPTTAHRTIARLIKQGHVRMILTTNFDRLLEIALQNEGVTPDVVSSVDMLKGAVPYAHSKCFIVKLHGDYKDTRIKNTTEELQEYAPELNALLDRVLDDFGLIVCGWSGEWDAALRAAIMRCPNRRFSTFWLARGGHMTEGAREIVAARRAAVIPLETADKFFGDLFEHVQSLQELKRPQPISTDLAIEDVKRYLTEPYSRNKLRDLIRNETEAAFQAFQAIPLNPNEPPTKDNFQSRMKRYEATVERLMAVLATLGFYDSGQCSILLTESIERFLGVKFEGGFPVWKHLQYYPALLLEYAAGFGALGGRNPKGVCAVLEAPAYREHSRGEKKKAIGTLNRWGIFDEGDVHKWVPLPDAEKKHTPVSDYLMGLFWPILKDYIPQKDKYEETFDLFEFLLGLAFMHEENYHKLPMGRYMWRWNNTWERSPMHEFVKGGNSWVSYGQLVHEGMFGGDDTRFFEMVKRFDAWRLKVSWDYR